MSEKKTITATYTDADVTGYANEYAMPGKTGDDKLAILEKVIADTNFTFGPGSVSVSTTSASVPSASLPLDVDNIKNNMSTFLGDENNKKLFNTANDALKKLGVTTLEELQTNPGKFLESLKNSTELKQIMDNPEFKSLLNLLPSDLKKKIESTTADPVATVEGEPVATDPVKEDAVATDPVKEDAVATDLVKEDANAVATDPVTEKPPEGGTRRRKKRRGGKTAKRQKKSKRRYK